MYFLWMCLFSWEVVCVFNKNKQTNKQKPTTTTTQNYLLLKIPVWYLLLSVCLCYVPIAFGLGLLPILPIYLKLLFFFFFKPFFSQPVTEWTCNSQPHCLIVETNLLFFLTKHSIMKTMELTWSILFLFPVRIGSNQTSDESVWNCNRTLIRK